MIIGRGSIEPLFSIDKYIDRDIKLAEKRKQSLKNTPEKSPGVEMIESDQSLGYAESNACMIRGESEFILPAPPILIFSPFSKAIHLTPPSAL